MKTFIEQEVVYLKNRCLSLEKAVIWLAYSIADERKGEKKHDEFIDDLKRAMKLKGNEIETL